MEPFWVSPYGDERMFYRWLAMMNIKYANFDRRRYLMMQRISKNWYNCAAAMLRQNSFNGDTLRKLFPEAYHTRWVNMEHDNMQKYADVKKLNWIYSSISKNPLGVLGALKDH